jgi:hypothetical protein
MTGLSRYSDPMLLVKITTVSLNDATRP